jgi:hypothetical protein
MTKRQLNLAGWLSIANAVLLPVSLSMTVLALFARGDNQLIFLIIALIITFIRHGFYLYTFSCLKKILNSRFEFRDADKFISQILRLQQVSICFGRFKYYVSFNVRFNRKNNNKHNATGNPSSSNLKQLLVKTVWFAVVKNC